MTALLIRLFVKNYEDYGSPEVRERYGTLGSIVGIICNLLLCGFKIALGLLTHSISIAADGFNNLTDMGSSVITMLGFKLANKPADSDHPFGHGRMEYMSAFVVAVVILLVGFELLKTSVTAIFKGVASPQFSVLSVVILVISILVKLWMFIFNRKIGKKISSEALIATAQDSLNDAVATTAVLVAVIASRLFQLPFNLDAVMGICVAVFILYSGISSAKNTLDQILGAPPEKELISEIENTILSFEEFVGLHDLIVHNYGHGRQFASVHVEVPHDTDIVKCHEQIDLCENLIKQRLGVSVVIHMDPIDTNDESITLIRSQLANAITVIHERLTLHDFRMTPASDKQTNLIFDVVVPADLKLSHKELQGKIEKMAQLINPTFVCVITFDNDYTGA